MKKTDSRTRLLLSVVMIALACTPRALAQATTEHVGSSVPISGTLGACNSEPIEISGFLHIHSNFTSDDTGGTHSHMMLNSQGISGVGLITGDSYRVIDVEISEVSSAVQGATETTSVFVFKIIGKGQAENLSVFTEVHVTMNANGDVTADTVNVHGNCA